MYTSPEESRIAFAGADHFLVEDYEVYQVLNYESEDIVPLMENVSYNDSDHSFAIELLFFYIF